MNDIRNAAKDIASRLRDDAINLEEDITPGETNEDIYRERVSQLRADADVIDQLVAENESLRPKPRIALHIPAWNFEAR